MAGNGLVYTEIIINITFIYEKYLPVVGGNVWYFYAKTLRGLELTTTHIYQILYLENYRLIFWVGGMSIE